MSPGSITIREITAKPLRIFNFVFHLPLSHLLSIKTSAIHDPISFVLLQRKITPILFGTFHYIYPHLLPHNLYLFRRLPAMTLSHLASPKGNERQTILDTADSVSPAALQRNTRNDTFMITWLSSS